MAQQIKAMRIRLDKIATLRKFHLEERPTEANLGIRLGRDKTHSSPPAIVVGRENDKQILIEILLSPDYNENVSIIPVVVIGGLGKTTLAQLVYNDQMVQKNFELQMWACISDDVDVKSIVEKMSEFETKLKPNVSHMDALENILHELINGRKYLLVLDDVWNEDLHSWLHLKDLLMGGARGSKIVSLRISKPLQIWLVQSMYMSYNVCQKQSHGHCSNKGHSSWD